MDYKLCHWVETLRTYVKLVQIEIFIRERFYFYICTDGNLVSAKCKIVFAILFICTSK